VIVTASAVVLLGALVVVLYRYAGLRAWHGAVCVLFGFFLATTSLAPYIRDGARALGRLLAGIHL
jgi:hypothetical protein